MDCDKYSMADFIEYNHEDIFEKTRLFSELIDDYIEKKFFMNFRPLLNYCGPRVRIFDRYTNKEQDMIMLASNNYLGLSYRPEVIEAGKKALEKYGCAMGGSPLLCGYTDLHRELEIQLARFEKTEDAIVFPTGFSTNIGVISGLLRKNDVIISDRLDHASIIDGCLFSGAEFRSFGHNDLIKMEKILAHYQGTSHGRLVVVEGVYSMDGDLARLDEIRRITTQYGARMMVDEAHATGVLGADGGGSIEHFNLQGKVDLVIGTFSKSLGGIGGYACAQKEVITYLRYYARSYFFSASLSPVVVACVLKALEILQAEPQLRQKLWENVNYLRTQLVKLGFILAATQSAIIPIIVGDDSMLRRISSDLHQKGIFVNSIFFPAVPKDASRIRISIMSDHTQADLDIALDALKQVGRKYKIIP